MGQRLSSILGRLGIAMTYPIVVLLVAVTLWLPSLIIQMLPLPRPVRARGTYALRTRLWKLIATAKFWGNKPKHIPIPGRLAWWRWGLVFLLGKRLTPIGRVPLNQALPGIPITTIQVAGHEPADEWDAAMKFFTWLQVTLYRLFSPMQAGLPQIDATPYAAVGRAYTDRHRRLFDPPVMPLECQGSPDLGALAVQGPYAGYLKKCGRGEYEWDFRELGERDARNPHQEAYEYHPGLYTLGVRVLFRFHEGSRTVQPVHIESELGVTKHGDRQWALAKTLALCAATNHLSLVRHFNGIHLASTAHVAIATRNHLFPDHPLGRFLWPYIFGTQSSNRAVTPAQMVQGGDFDSIFSFTHAGMCELFSATYRQYRFIVNDPEKDAEARGIKKAGFDTPTQDDLETLFQVFYRHAKAYVDIYYKTDDALKAEHGAPILQWLNELNDPHHGIPNGLPITARQITTDGLARLLASVIYLVTVHHDLVGSFLWNYQLWAHAQPPRLYRDGRRLPWDVYQRLVNANFNLNVRRTPLMHDFAYLLLRRDGHRMEVEGAFQRFQRELAECDARWRSEPWHVWRVYPGVLEVNINA